MEEGSQDRAPREHEVEEADIKKHHDATTHNNEEEDVELAEKKDGPPRFSTLFGGTPAPIVIERDPPRSRRSGVFIPMPVFVFLALLLLLLLTITFAFSVIGLYNVRPAGVFGSGSCDCSDKGINIAPNFVMPGAATVTVTASHGVVLPDSLPSGTKTVGAEVASEVKSMLSTLLPKTTPTPPVTTAVVTFTPPPKVVATSVALFTVGPNGSTLSPSTVTSLKTVPPSSPTPSPSAGNGAKEVNLKSALSSAEAALTPDPIPSPSPKQTSA